MNKAVIYIHGKGGSAAESAHYAPFFPGCDLIGFDYAAQTPWEAAEEFAAYFGSVCEKYGAATVIANSIGAYFAMCAPADTRIERAYFISPVVDMEKLITDMMAWANVSEAALLREKEIDTSFGETLSWAYLCWVREHPVMWNVPTHILYGENDSLCAYESVSAFAARHGASLTVMPGGEHWFHTAEQMAFLDGWICSSLVS